jgi:ATP-dependent RNA helicase DDX27
MDLVKTIEDTDEINYESDSSREEIEEDRRAPITNKQRLMIAKTHSEDFNESFTFVANQKEYMKDTWSDMSAYIRKKAKTTLVDKIAKVRKERLDVGGAEESDDSEDEMKSDEDEDENNEELWDDIKIKQADAKRKKKKDKGAQEDPKQSIVRIEKSGNDVGKQEKYEEFFEYDDSATFQSMNLSRPLLKSIETLKWGHPTPIQAATIPTALSGKDICGCAATGTGKTAAYVLPILERLLFRSMSDSVTRVLVVVPTRELGVQVFQVCKQLAQFTTVDVALSVGGLDLRIQEAELRRNPDVVIATPGRLVDHIKNTPSFSLDSVEVLILDEADRLLDESFLDQMKEIVKSCAPTRQTMLFSATMTEKVNELALVSLKSPVKIFVDSNRAVAWNLQQEFVRVRPAHESKQEAILAALLTRTFTDHVIVFIRTKQECHRLHIILGLLGLRAAQLHGNMSQAQRLQSLKQFKEEQIDILLTTVTLSISSMED